MPPSNSRVVLQCDFDGTITAHDVSFMLLDVFADGDWRKIHEEYHAARMTVGEFNTRVFAMVKASRETMLDYLKGRVELREGLPELAHVCERKDIKLVVVSNGLDFYIEQILKDMGLSHIESHAAHTIFKPTGLDVAYFGPAGNVLTDGFKEAYTRFFLEQGYRVIYAGDGFSDAGAARLAHKVFAIEGLLSYCRQVNLPCSTFCKLLDIAREIEGL
jgi:2-hydroxy-3-keto-5-methylthiopentenyl-1-phosphate phosphatase